jgi:hypothetical protein
VFTASDSSGAAAPARSAGAGPASGAGWHLTREGKTYGPYSTADMQSMAASGHLLPTDSVWQEGMSDWVNAGEVPQLFATVRPTPPADAPGGARRAPAAPERAPEQPAAPARSPAPAGQPSGTPRKKVELYMEYLQGEGYAPKVDDDGDVVFKHEGGTYIMFADEQDRTYFRLVFPAFWEIESEEEGEQVHQTMCELNGGLKVVKFYVVRNNTWASVEMFVDPIENFPAVFGRCLSLLGHARNQFRQKMRPEG